MRYGPCSNHICFPLRVKESTLQRLGFLPQAAFDLIMVDIGLFCGFVVVRRREVFGNPIAAVGKTTVWESEPDCRGKTPHVLQGGINSFEPSHKGGLVTKLVSFSLP